MPNRWSRSQDPPSRQSKHTGRLAPCRYDVWPASSSLQSLHISGRYNNTVAFAYGDQVGRLTSEELRVKYGDLRGRKCV